MPVVNTQLKTLVFSDTLQILLWEERDLDYESIGKQLQANADKIDLSDSLSIDFHQKSISLQGFRVTNTTYLVVDESKEFFVISFSDLGITQEKVRETVEYLHHLGTIV